MGTDPETGEPRVTVTGPEKTAEQAAREEEHKRTVIEAFGEGGSEIPEKLWIAFGSGTDKGRLRKGVDVPAYGLTPWYGYSRHFTASDGERHSLTHGVAVTWPNHGPGSGNHLATIEPGDREGGSVLVVYHPGYAPRTRKTKRPEAVSQEFPGPVNGGLVRRVREWLHERLAEDKFAQAFRAEDAAAKEAKAEEGRAKALEAEREAKAARARRRKVDGRAFRGLGKVAIIDVETTGLDPENDRIIEIAAARGDLSEIARGNTSPYFQTLEVRVNPGVKIPKGASEVHGIWDKDVKGLDELDREVGQQIRDFIGGRAVVAHNCEFDTAFLNAALRGVGVKELVDNPLYCTMKRFRQLCPGEPSSLDAVAGIFGKQRSGERHNALEDVMLAIQVAGHLYKHDNGIGEAKSEEKAAKSWKWLLWAGAAVGAALIVFAG